MEEFDRDLLAAVGEVVVEATTLEYALARVVAARCGWSETEVWPLVARPNCVRSAVRAVVKAEPDWSSVRDLYRDACAVLDDRNVLVHSLAVEVSGDDLPSPRAEIWHPKSGTTAEQPTAGAVLEHAFDIRRCFRRAVNLIREAEARYRSVGSLSGISPPKLLDWQAEREE